MHKLGDIYDAYIKSKTGKLKLSTLRTYNSLWKNYLSGLSAIDIRLLKPEDIEAYLPTFQCAPSRNRTIQLLASIFKFAHLSLQIEVKYVTRSLERGKESSRKRFLSELDWRKLNKGLHLLDKGNIYERDFAVFIQLILYTGLRKSEAENSRWENIDWKRRCLLIKDGKTGDREVPLPDILLDLLKPRRKDIGFLFPAKKSRFKGRNWSYRWMKFRKDVGIPYITRHDLRRSYGVTALNSGLSIEEVAALLGHSSIQTTQKCYAWLTTESKRKASDKVAEAIQRM